MRGSGGTAFHLLLLMPCLAGGVALAMVLGADTMWDIRNYHIYNAFAFVNGRLDADILPAAYQSYLNPLPDLPFYYVLTRFGAVAATALLGVYYGLLVYVVLLLNRKVFAQPGLAAGLPPAVSAWLLPLAATFIGVTGGAGWGQAVTATNEVQLATLALASLLLVLPADDGPAPRAGRMLLGGVLMGAAAGLKLTATIYLVAAVVMLLPWRRERGAVRRLLVFAAGALAGLVITFGDWAATLYAKFQNPVFPFYNGIFKSPWIAPVDLFDARWTPKTVLEAIAYPAWWAFESATRVSELFVRDPRFLIFLLLAPALVGLHFTFRPLPRSFRLLLAFGIAAYLVWLWRFGYLRYGIPIEVITGTLIVAAIPIVRRAGALRPLLASAGAIVAAVALLLYTRPPDWGRVPFEDAYTVRMETVPDGSAIVLAGQPMAYLAALMPGRDLHFAGVMRWTLGEPALRDAVVRLLDASGGRAWTLLRPGSPEEALIPTLGWSVVAARCSPVWTTIDPAGIVLCPLERSS